MKHDFISLRKKIKNYLPNKEDNELFYNTFMNTIDTAISFDEDGSVFVLTGDIPAMWLRDSAASVMQYLEFINEEGVKELIKGVIKKELKQIIHDPYANSFMHDNKTISEWANTDESDIIKDDIWERKFELDSLCYPFFLICKYYEKTDDLAIFNNEFILAFDEMIKVVNIERNHSKKSSYYLLRRKNGVIKYTVGKNTNSEEEKGLVWSGFRPSDDKCTYHYHIPDNMFLVSILFKLIPIFEKLEDQNRKEISLKLISEISNAITKYGIKDIKGFGKIYVSETNCLGDYELNDDANVPSLLSIPYLEYPFIDMNIYQNTRNYILSNNNAYFFKGTVLEGIGSPHTKGEKVWPLAISMQGITSNDSKEIKKCYKMLKESAKYEHLMHESVDVNEVKIFTRPWFAWANSLFSYFVILKKDKIFN